MYLAFKLILELLELHVAIDKIKRRLFLVWIVFIRKHYRIEALEKEVRIFKMPQRVLLRRLHMLFLICC